MGAKICVIVVVNMSLNMDVNMGVSMGENMVVNIKFGITLLFKHVTIIFLASQKNISNRCTNGQLMTVQCCSL